jgi:hypothetical protein
MPWRVLRLERLHEGDVVCLDRAEVELNDGTRVDGHHIVRVRIRVVSLVLRDAEGRYPLLRRHRFIVDRWCWDVPAGRSPKARTPSRPRAAQRSKRPVGAHRGVREVAVYHPNPGMSDQEFTVCVGEGAERVGPVDPNEAERVEWVPREEVLSRIQRGDIDGLSLTSLLLTLVPEPDGSPTSEGSHNSGRARND